MWIIFLNYIHTKIVTDACCSIDGYYASVKQTKFAHSRTNAHISTTYRRAEIAYVVSKIRNSIKV